MPNRLMPDDPFAGQTGAFGVASPGELANADQSVLDRFFRGLVNNLVTLPKRAIEASNNRLVGGDYDPGPILEAAMLPMGTGALAGVPMRAGETVLGAGPIRAYHGSPHDFDRFDLSKIGTGEGAQAYGHGLYFAERESVAKSYRDALTDAVPTVNGRVQAAGPGKFNIVDDFGVQAGPFPTLEEAKASLTKQPGRMYEVQIKADPEHFLDWDKPLSAQPEVVARLPAEFRDQMRGYGEKSKADWGDLGVGSHPSEYETGQAMVRRIARPSFPIRDNPQSPWKASSAKSYEEALAMVGGDKSRVNKMLTPDPTYTSEALREAGIPGIKYLDQGSRGAGDGSRNFVVFDDKLVDIIKKYGMAGMSMLPPATAAFLSSKIKPVDHDPFGPGLVPVDHDPFAEKL